ncbi:hypothetical protein ACQCRI_13415 [Ralstonia pseudosolanacearum]|uniref:hypothetical protein n=1 Tax=Ralstonia pseudosolanacearum TaxID=1310165 RepID=UPI001402FA7F
MSILENLVRLTDRIEGLHGVSEAIQKVKDANGALETTAAVSQLAAELAITTAVTATVRTSMSVLRLGLAVSGQIWKWEALSWAAGAGSGMTAGQIIDWVNDQHIGSKIYDWTHPVSNSIGTTPDPLGIVFKTPASAGSRRKVRNAG